MKKRRVIGYGRVSTEEQENNYSLSAQETHYTKLCEKNDWQSLGFHSEVGSGTSISGRPILCQVLQQVKSGMVDALWVKESDRLTRPENLGDISTIVDTLASTSTQLIIGSREYDPNEDSDVLTLDFQGVMAKYFRRQLLRNMDRGKVRKAQMGRKAVGADIFGYQTNEQGEYIPDPEQSKIIKRIFNLAMNDLTVRQIAAELQRQHIQTATGRKRWSLGVIASILKNEHYIGIYRFQKTKQARDGDGTRYRVHCTNQIVAGTREAPNHSPLVEPWVFDVVQAKLKARKVVIMRSRTVARVFA